MRILGVILTPLVAFANPAAAQVDAPPPRTATVQVSVNLIKEGRAPVPFELVKGNILFRAHVAGKDVWAMLDNRADPSLIDTGFARDAGLRVGPPTGVIRTATGVLEKSLLFDVPIAIPGQVEFRAPITAVDLSAYSKIMEHSIQLVVGREYLGNMELFVSPGSKTFMLGRSGSLVPPNRFAPIILENNRPQLKLLISGREALVTLDLGFSGALMLNPSAWARLAPGTKLTPHMIANGEGKLIDAKLGYVPEVVIGQLTAKNLPVNIAPTVPADSDGLLGMGILSRFDFLLDIPASKLWIAPLSAFQVSAG
jgi:hypothetical protein